LKKGRTSVVKKVNIKIIDPNNNKQLEEALSDIIAYELVNKEMEKMAEEDVEKVAINL